MSVVSVLVILFCVAIGVAMAAQRMRVPYTVALVIAGLILGLTKWIVPPHLTKELLFSLFLPGLVFEAAFNLDYGEFRRCVRTIGILAVPGVAVATIVCALIATTFVGILGMDPGFALTQGMVFGALVAATDPVAVTALFRQMSVPRRLTTLVEGESLLNDGTGIVFFTLVLAYATGAAVSTNSLLSSFLTITVGGALVGAALGVAASIVTRRVEDAMIEITLSTITAYGSFVLAEHLHFSGVIATVVAGMIYGNYTRRVGMTPTTRLAVGTFWEYVAFSLNSIVFLLIGLEVPLAVLASSWGIIIIASLAVLAARTCVVFASALLVRKTSERLPSSWSWVLTWGGMRGALSMVLALSLPDTLPHRDIIITMTVGVVIVSLLLQGLTMSTLLERLGFSHTDHGMVAYNLARAEQRVTRAAIEHVSQLRPDEDVPEAMLGRMRQHYERRSDEANARLAELGSLRSDVFHEQNLVAVRKLLLLERDELVEGFRDGTFQREVYELLVADVDRRLVWLVAGEFEHPDDLVAPHRDRRHRRAATHEPRAKE